jgi:acid phosphatase type 7
MRPKIFIVLILILSLSGLSLALGIVSTPVSASGTALTFSAVAEATVDSSQPDAVVASQSGLRTDGIPEIDSYVRFNVSGLSAPIASAVLQVSANSISGSGYIVRGVADNSWDPSNITFANAPAMGQELGASGAFGAGVMTSVDVTEFVTGNGSFSFALTSSDPLPVSYGAGGPPQLVITPAVVTPTPSGPAFGTPKATNSVGAGGAGAFPGTTPTAPIGSTTTPPVGSTPGSSKTDEPDHSVKP